MTIDLTAIDCSGLRVVTGHDPGSAAYNMAVDEVLLRGVDRAVLRHYTWRNSSVSFGYFEKYRDICTLFPKREKVRRWTGGGIVLHGEDFTFSLMLSRARLGREADSSAIYEWIHSAVVEALHAEGLEVELAGGASNPAGTDCFTNPVRADVLMEGRKVVGGALRKTRAGMLYQGSIQGLQVGEGFLAVLASHLGSEPEWDKLTPEELGEAETLAVGKYATVGWTEKF